MIRVADLDDPRLEPYRDLTNPDAVARAGLFVAEGRLVVRRLLASTRFVTRSVLLTDAAHLALRDLLEAHAGRVPIFVVEPSAMNQIAGFNIHRGCLAIAERPSTPSIDALALDRMRRVVMLEGVNNPDNVGGIFRSAAAFGVDAIVLGPAAGDPLYRKAVRTSMAASLAVPFAAAGEWPAALRALRDRGFRVLALTPDRNATPLDEYPGDAERIALMVGAEGEGLTDGAMAAADARVRIPMSGSTDSLNVTVAASIAMWHFAR